MTEDVQALPVVVLPDAEAAAIRCAEDIAALLRSAVAERGIAHLAVSGGTTPWRMLAHLDILDLPWERIHVYQVDERIAPDGDPDRNLTRLVEVLHHGTLHPVPVGTVGPAAAAYALVVPERFDVVQLGIGADGHTASLVPGDAVLGVTDRAVAATAGPYAGRYRVTLTFPALAAARAIRWLVTGDEKQKALRRLLDADPSVPAGCVARHHALVVADIAAFS